MQTIFDLSFNAFMFHYSRQRMRQLKKLIQRYC